MKSSQDNLVVVLDTNESREDDAMRPAIEIDHHSSPFIKRGVFHGFPKI